MAEYPALSIWTDAYLADTRHLTAAQHGAYLLLLFEAWRSPTCSLPIDDRKLAPLAAMTLRQWQQNKEVVLAFWEQRNGFRFYQKRLLQERARADSRRQQMVEAGKASSRKRAAKSSNPNSTYVEHTDQQNSNIRSTDVQHTDQHNGNIEATTSYPIPHTHTQKRRKTMTKESDAASPPLIDMPAAPSVPEQKEAGRKPNDFKEFEAYCASKGIIESDTRALYATFVAGGWTRDGRPIVNWKAHVSSWQFNGYLASQKANKK
jgi:uncharacterized protein YdaU (DUF1376 family)